MELYKLKNEKNVLKNKNPLNSLLCFQNSLNDEEKNSAIL